MAENLKVACALLFLVAMVRGQQLTYQVDVNAPSGPSLAQRSLADGAAQGGVPRSSKRRMHCRSLMWAKECEKGSPVIATRKQTSEEGCDLFCSNDQVCNSFMYNAETLDCGLTNLKEGTTTSNGISGPNLILQKPTLRKQKMFSYSAAGPKEDCTGFHFDGCDTHFGPRDWPEDYDSDNKRTGYWYDKMAHNLKVCRHHCKSGTPSPCESYAWMDGPSGSQMKPGTCGMHNEASDDLIEYNCKWLTGRVDRTNSDPNALDSCMFNHNRHTGERNDCRKGYCNLDFWGPVVLEEESINEEDCKSECWGRALKVNGQPRYCTHYKYFDDQHSLTNPENANNGKCQLFVVLPGKNPPYKCNMQVYRKGIHPVKKIHLQCREDEHPVDTNPDGPGTTATGGPTQSTPTPPTTHPIETPPDCKNGMMDIAFLFDDSGSMHPPKQQAVKNWMKKLIQIYNIDGGIRRAAIMQWSKKARVITSFEDGLTKDELMDEIDDIEHMSGTTRGVKALNKAFKRFFQGRPRSWKAVIFLSDGDNKDGDLGKAAEKFHRKEIRITSVYLGKDNRSVQDMKKMLGKNLKYKNKFFQAKDITELTNDQFVRAVSGCPVGL